MWFLFWLVVLCRLSNAGWSLRLVVQENGENGEDIAHEDLHFHCAMDIEEPHAWGWRIGKEMLEGTKGVRGGSGGQWPWHSQG